MQSQTDCSGNFELARSHKLTKSKLRGQELPISRIKYLDNMFLMKQNRRKYTSIKQTTKGNPKPSSAKLRPEPQNKKTPKKLGTRPRVVDKEGSILHHQSPTDSKTISSLGPRQKKITSLPATLMPSREEYLGRHSDRHFESKLDSKSILNDLD